MKESRQRPSEALSVSGVAQTLGTPISPAVFNHPVLKNSPVSGDIYVSAVPLDSSGNPQYGTVPPPNSYCANSAYGVLQYFTTTAAANGVTACNYALLGTNTSASNSSNLNVQANDPLAFTYDEINGNATGTGDLDTTSFAALTGTSTNNTGTATKYYNELYVTSAGSTSYNATGKTVVLTPLYGYCPAHNLYGLMEAYPNTGSTDIVPYQDSIVSFNSTYEAQGWPPTHGSNHMLLPFLGPVNTQVVNGTTYTVRAVCPQWPTTNTSISATASFSPGSLPAGYSPVTSASGYPTATVKVFATYYPDIPYSGSTGVWPPAVAGCAPAYSLTDGGVTPLLDDPWWGWSPNNALQMDPGGAAENPGGAAEANCTSAALNSAGTLVVTTLNALQPPKFNNCALLIQPLGTIVPSTNGIPNLPDYYTINVGLLSYTLGTTGNASSIINSAISGSYGMTPVFDGATYNGVTNTNAAGYVPTGISISINLLGATVISEPPAYGRDYYLPEDTSHQCYNAQANGINGTVSPYNSQTNNDNASVIDPVENPQYGAVYCGSNPPLNFALYWNDMASSVSPALYNDDLGYFNAITEFTCPLVSGALATGPPVLTY